MQRDHHDVDPDRPGSAASPRTRLRPVPHRHGADEVATLGVAARPAPAVRDEPTGHPGGGRRTSPHAPATLLRLQRTAGNRAVGVAIQRSPPQASAASTGTGTTTAVHEGVTLSADPAQVRDTLQQQVVLKGWDGTRAWTTRFINMDVAAELRFGELGQNVPPDVLRRMREVLDQQWTAFTVDRDQFLADFERRSVGTATQVLDTSQKQIDEQLASLGIKKATFLGFETGGHEMDKGKALGLKAAAEDLIAKRREADQAAKVHFAARDKAKAIFDRTSAPSLAEALPEVFLPPDLAAEVESTRERGLALAREYDALAAEKHTTFPILATVSGGSDAIRQLQDLASRKPDDMATKIALVAQEKTDNIKAVRGELGARYSVWKEPNLRAITKQAMAATAWQSRVVEEKAAVVTAQEQDTKMLMAAVAIGLGLIAAIPTAGGSLAVAGVVTAAATGSMVLSVYGAYEHYQDYTLAAAAQGSSFDKAKAISQGDPPDIFWLAVDIVTAITDIQAAAQAFKAIKVILAEAKAAETAEKVSELVAASRKAGLAEETQSKLVAAAMGPAGDTKKVATSLDQIMQVFKRARKVGTDAELTEAFLKAAEKAKAEERIALYAGTAEEKQKMVLDMVRRHAPRGTNVEAEAAKLQATIDKAGTAGVYDPVTNTIIVKGNRSASAIAATLAHELAHQKQHLAIGLERMGTMHTEFQAFYAQQQFLKNLDLPAHRTPKGYEWLLNADMAKIRQHVIDRYTLEFGPVTWKTLDDSAAWIIKTMKTGR